MVRFHLQWLDRLRHCPAGERHAMSRVWGRAFPYRTLPPLDLRKDDLCRSDKVGESRCFCAPARHSRKACHSGPSWRFICTLETYLFPPTSFRTKIYWHPLLNSISGKTSAPRRALTFPISERTWFKMGFPFIATLDICQIAKRVP